MKDRKVWEFSKWGRGWVAQLRTFPADGSFAAGYVTSHISIRGGEKEVDRLIREFEEAGQGAECTKVERVEWTSSDICASRDDAQPHIFDNEGVCELCYALAEEPR